MAAPTVTLMTAEEFLALPDDGVERWLINGELREVGMTKRNRLHSRTMILLGTALENWLRTQPPPRGEVLAGDAGVILSRDPDCTVGIDVAYVSAEVLSHLESASALVEGLPVLAAEILSPSDTQERIHEKLHTYLEAGVPLIWILDPVDWTVRVYRPDAAPELFNARHELSGDPELPGFRVPVARLFE